MPKEIIMSTLPGVVDVQITKEVDDSHNFFVIGDVHGHLDALNDILSKWVF